MSVEGTFIKGFVPPLAREAGVFVSRRGQFRTGGSASCWVNQGHSLGIAFSSKRRRSSSFCWSSFLFFSAIISISISGLWGAGWLVFHAGIAVSEVAMLSRNLPVRLWLAVVVGRVAAMLLFSAAVVQFTTGAGKRGWPILPLAGVVLLGVYYFQRGVAPVYANVPWGTALLASVVCLWAGMVLWRSPLLRRGHGVRLLEGVFLLTGLHGLDRPLWPEHPYFLLRVAFDHLLGVALGIAMVVVVLEGARSRTVELNEKLRRLTLLTTASTQTLSVQEVLDRVLAHLVESLEATHGLVRLLEGEGDKAEVVVHASVGFQKVYLEKYRSLLTKAAMDAAGLAQGLRVFSFGG